MCDRVKLLMSPLTMYGEKKSLRTCVGMIVSRRFRIVSTVSGGCVVVLLFSLWLGPVLDELGNGLIVGCWSDSLPNIKRAFPET